MPCSVEQILSIIFEMMLGSLFSDSLLVKDDFAPGVRELVHIMEKVKKTEVVVDMAVRLWTTDVCLQSCSNYFGYIRPFSIGQNKLKIMVLFWCPFFSCPLHYWGKLPAGGSLWICRFCLEHQSNFVLLSLI